MLLVLGLLAFISVLGSLGLVSVFTIGGQGNASSSFGYTLVEIDGALVPQEEFRSLAADWKAETRFLPDDQLAILALEGTGPASEPATKTLIWNPRDFAESRVMDDVLDRVLLEFANDGYSFEEVDEPLIGPDLQAELQEFPMPVTRLDGSLAPPVGLFRMADRIGLSRFSFLTQEDGVSDITTYTTDDDEWQLSVRLAPLN